MLRNPAVAGRFYPDQREQLSHDVKAYLAEAVPSPAIGIVSPHAGYMFSGAIAGETFASVEVPGTVIVLGPNHYGYGPPLALWEGEAWLTPLGKIPIDRPASERLRQLCPDLLVDATAHRQEHSLEVQIPFIQCLNPESALVAVAIGLAPLSSLKSLGEAIARLALEREVAPLIVASSDMTHFESSEAASRKDHLALEHVVNLDPEGLFRTVRDQRISMCGVLPVVAMLFAAQRLGATNGTLVRYGNSGETTGDYQDVVGYAGVVIR